jgi:hypothetical protein
MLRYDMYDGDLLWMDEGRAASVEGRIPPRKIKSVGC